jgi:hypothetical protein
MNDMIISADSASSIASSLISRTTLLTRDDQVNIQIREFSCATNEPMVYDPPLSEKLSRSAPTNPHFSLYALWLARSDVPDLRTSPGNVMESLMSADVWCVWQYSRRTMSVAPILRVKQSCRFTFRTSLNSQRQISFEFATVGPLCGRSDAMMSIRSIEVYFEWCSRL